MRHPSLSTTRLITRFLEAFFCCLVLGTAAWILDSAPGKVWPSAFAVAAAGVGLCCAAAHILIPPCVHLTHHGNRLLNKHPLADALASTALCLVFLTATALLFHDSLTIRGCVMGARRREGPAISANGTASKEAQASFVLDDHIHQWPLARNDTRSQAHVGWTMLVEVLFAGQLSAAGRDPGFQRQLAAHVKRVWGPYTTDSRVMGPRRAAPGAPAAPPPPAGGWRTTPNAEDLTMDAIYDAGEVFLNPRGGAPPARAAPFNASALDEKARKRLAGYVTIAPEPGAELVGPGFVGYDMIETTLRVYGAGEPESFMALVGPFIKSMWAPYTRPMETPYDELSDYDKVLVDAYNAGAVDLDVFRPSLDAAARRRQQAAAAADAARQAAMACSLLELVIAACLLSALAFGSSAALAGLEMRRVKKGLRPHKGHFSSNNLAGMDGPSLSVSRAPSLRGPPGDALAPAGSIGGSKAGDAKILDPFG